jgi:RND family efflux transporter MFP subunit
MSHFSWKQRLLIIPPLALGAVLLLLAPGMKAEPPKAADVGGKKVVRVIKVTPRDIQPMAVGYGLTQPAMEWLAQAEVEGRVTWISEQFKAGDIVKQDQLLLKLDPSSYQLSITKLNAELNVAKLKDQTLAESLSIAEKNYALQKEEFERSAKLLKAGHLSQTEKDRAMRDLLNSQQQVQSLKNEQAINQAEQKVLQTELAMAQRDLAHSEIRAPFDLRITAKHVDFASYVSKGEALLEGDGIASTEVLAQFPLGKMRPLRRNSGEQPLAGQLHSDLTATVELEAADRIIRWPARVDRAGGAIDAQTQSQTIVVQVDQPYQQASPGNKPPLIRDTFVKVILKAPALTQQILLPLNALHGDKVYLLKDGKLAIQPVKVDFIQNQLAVIQSGLQAGDTVVVSQLQPAVEGMTLKPQPDKNLNQWISKQAEAK